MNVTDFIQSKTQILDRSQEGNHHFPGFTNFNTGGVENEVGELLHALVRVFKPELVFETGTHLGISAAYMALALHQNGKGSLTTVDTQLYPRATKLWRDLGIKDQIHFIQGKSLEVNLEATVDILLLDTEPALRFDEFVRFYPNVRDGGLIIIHDLHPHLSYEGTCWPYGDFRPKLARFMFDHSVQTMSFPTPRGLTIFQKAAENFSFTKLLRGTLPHHP